LKPHGYAEPEFLSELFRTEKGPLLQDFKSSCKINNGDFAKMSLRFEKVYREVKNGG